MIRTSLLIIFGISLFITSCKTGSSSSSNQISKKFVGSWYGNEEDSEKKGIVKNWIQHRFKDGTYVILFTAIEDCKIKNVVERGTWWIENDLFIEKNFTNNKTDSYYYEILDDKNIKFKSKKVSFKHENDYYEFIDTKID